MKRKSFLLYEPYFSQDRDYIAHEVMIPPPESPPRNKKKQKKTPHMIYMYAAYTRTFMYSYNT